MISLINENISSELIKLAAMYGRKKTYEKEKEKHKNESKFKKNVRELDYKLQMAGI